MSNVVVAEMDGASLEIDREPYDGLISRRRTSYLRKAPGRCRLDALRAFSPGMRIRSRPWWTRAARQEPATNPTRRSRRLSHRKLKPIGPAAERCAYSLNG